MTITAPADQFAGHVAGEAYELTREHFIRTQPGWQWQESDRHRAALWAAIARAEALRTFNPLAQLCHSELAMDTKDGFHVA